MKKLLLQGAWMLMACFALLLLSRCHNDTQPLQPQKQAVHIPPPPPPKVSGNPEPDAHQVYHFAEQMPRFPGGEQDLMKYLHDHIHYPAVARENGNAGTVVVQFVVGTDGKLSDIHAVDNHTKGGLQEEAIRVVKDMPAWQPGKQDGRKVAVQYSLPIRFQLQ